MMTLYQLNVSPSRLTQAINEISLTWQEGDSLLLFDTSGILGERVLTHFSHFNGKILVLENKNLVGNNMAKISLVDWVNLTQQHAVITLDFS